MTEWISVKDRLPEEGIYVLTYDERNDEMRVDSIVFVPEDEKTPYIWYCRLYSDWDSVSHWMPLPKPPEEKRSPEVETIYWIPDPK